MTDAREVEVETCGGTVSALCRLTGRHYAATLHDPEEWPDVEILEACTIDGYPIPLASLDAATRAEIEEAALEADGVCPTCRGSGYYTGRDEDDCDAEFACDCEAGR